MAGKCLCMDVGGSSIKYALIDETLSLTEQGKVPTPYGSLEEYLSALESIWKPFSGQAEGIAMSVPGIIDSENGVCVTAGALDGFAHGVELVRELEARCGVPVTIMNDAKCAALAEAAWGALSDCRDGIVLVLGAGVLLVARKPGFYKKLNFTVVPPEEAPQIFDCLGCPQFQTECFPEIMKYEIPAEGPVLREAGAGK